MSLAQMCQLEADRAVAGTTSVLFIIMECRCFTIGEVNYDHCNPSGIVMALCAPFIPTSTQHASVGVMANTAINCLYTAA